MDAPGRRRWRSRYPHLVMPRINDVMATTIPLHHSYKSKCHSSQLTSTLSSSTTISSTLARSMKFIAFGGGGKVAQHFAKSAIAQGHEVIAVVRDDSQ